MIQAVITRLLDGHDLTRGTSEFRRRKAGSPAAGPAPQPDGRDDAEGARPAVADESPVHAA